MVKSIDNAQSSGSGYVLGDPDEFHMREGAYEGLMGLECVSPRGMHTEFLGLHLPAPYTGTDTLSLHADAGVRGTSSALTMRCQTNDLVHDADGAKVDTKYLSTNGYVFNSSSDSRIIRNGSNIVQLRAGTGTLQVDNNANVIPNNTLILPKGTAAAPSLRFIASPTTGLSAATADQLVVSSAGTAQLTLTASAVTPSVPTRITHGSASAPSVIVGSDVGFYRNATDNVSVSAKTGVTVSTPATFTPTFAQFPLGITLPVGDTLSDYEITAPVPTMTLNGVALTLTVWNVFGIRIGKMQFIHGIIGWGAVPAQTGQWIISNAYNYTPAVQFTTPFLCATTTAFSSQRVFWRSGGGTLGFTAEMYAGGSGATTTTFVGGTDIIANGRMHYTFVYMIA